MRRARSNLARLLLLNTPVQDISNCADEIANYFERVGILLRRRLAPADLVWDTFSWEVLRFWDVLADYIRFVRESDRTIFSEFELLYKRMLELEVKYTGRGSVPGLSRRAFLCLELEVDLRIFSPGDLRNVFVLEHSCFGPQAYGKEKLRELDLENPDSFFVAEALGDIVGYVVASTQKDEAQIITLATDPGYRRFGVGSRLLKALLAKLRTNGIRACYVNVRPQNKIAIDFFDAAGFCQLKEYQGSWKIESRDARGGYMMRVTLQPERSEALPTAA
jgi:ribosomal-protein-alanine N-acetyltransferase